MICYDRDSDTSSSGWITIRGSYAQAPTQEELDAARTALVLANRRAFEDYIAGLGCGPEEGMVSKHIPRKRMMRKYGTSNGLRSEPMLC